MAFNSMFAHLDPDSVAGTFSIYNMIKVGGSWGVPRSGLVYRRDSETSMVLVARMPWHPDMEGTITPAQLEEQQQSDHEGMVAHLGAAGITVTDATSPDKEETS